MTFKHRAVTLFGWLVLASIMASSSGCTRVLATAVYFWKGNVIDPEFDGLTGKKVAVVCRDRKSTRLNSSHRT